MSQDTRKDKRAKVVSLNVRYKSATVDEFIENHSHDVSKGGLFVKTPTPFPPGTLLKFEIRLAGDKSVISGVGRVVWKREPTSAGAEKPAGMGVKFIKIDDASRAIIDRLITQKADAGSAYTSEEPIEDVPGHPSTLRGLTAATPAEPTAAPGPSPVNVPAAPGGGAGKLPVPPASAPTAGAGAAAAKAAPPPPVAKSPLGGGTLAGPRPSGVPNVPASSPKLPVAGAAGAAKPLPRPLGAPPAPAGKSLAQTAIGVAPAPGLGGATVGNAGALPGASDKPSEPKPAVPAAAAAPPPRPMPPPARKATMMGMGIPSSPPPPNEAGALPSPTPPPGATASATPPPAKTAEPMFPRHDPESGSEPARDQTVMKQAAELLEEALKEAGGSLDEIGQNPLFGKQGDASLHEQMPPSSRSQSGDTVIMSSPSAGSEPLTLGSSKPNLSPSAPGVTEPTARAGSSPSLGSPSQAPPAQASEARRLTDDLDSKKKGGNGALLVAALLALILAGGGVYAYMTGALVGIIGGPKPVPPTGSTAAPPPTPPTASGSASATPTPAMATTDAGAEATDASATTTATDAGMNAADAAADAVKDAGKAAVTTTAAPPPAPRPQPRPRPPAPPKPENTGDTPSTAPTPATPSTDTAPAPAPTPVPVPVPAPTKDPANEL